MRVKPLIAVPLIAIALAGCSTQQPTEEISTAAAQEQPLFSSDEEALAAAQAAYANYLEVSDQIARDGGANPERLKGLVSKSLYSDELSGFKQLQDAAWFASGRSTFDGVHLQKTSGSEISAYLCIDHSQIRLLDAGGLDVTSPSRVDRYPLVVTFSSSDNGVLTIDSSNTWSGQNFC